MKRLLVAPWHGLVTGGQIHLPNGETRPISQPTNHSLMTFGPGDTHQIQVPGVPPLTPEEVAATPAGGQYWAGKALITASSLYGAPVNWIYQAPDGSKWAAVFTRINITASATEISLSLSRFGEFGRPPEYHEKSFVVPVGRISREERQKIFADLGALSSCTVRVHAVSSSGQNVILAWCAFNDVGSTGEKDVDTRPRPFTFVKVSMSGAGEMIALEVQVLYRLDDILTETEIQVGGGYSRTEFLNLREVSRTPISDGAGNVYAHRVTYEYESTVPMVPVNGAGPGSYRDALNSSREQKWLVMVGFDGEQPVPGYLTLSANVSLTPMRFSASTEKPLIMIRYLDGSSNTEQEGKAVVSGGGSSRSNAVVNWAGPGESWAAYFSASSSASFDGTSTHLAIEYDGEVSGGAGPGMVDQPEPVLARLEGHRANRMPVIANWRFCLYSNNLMGIAKLKTRANERNDAEFLGGLTPVGFVQYAAPFAELDQRHYGSFNPITQQVVIGSSATVNWA